MTHPARSQVVAWVVAGVVFAVGVTTTIVGLSTPVSFGWFAYQPLADTPFAPGSDSVFLSRTTAVGLAVSTLGLLALAFLAGARFADRRQR